MLVDILTDGIFAAVAAIGFGAISDPPLRAFPSIALLAAIGHALTHCSGVLNHMVDVFLESRLQGLAEGNGLASDKTHLLPYDCAIYPCTATNDSGYVCLQNSILAHHVHAEPESARITGKISD